MLPKISQMLHIQVNSIDEEEAKQEYKSRISDMNDLYIMMELPISETTGRLKRLYPGDELSVYYLTEGGVKNFFLTSVIGFRGDPLRQVIIRKPELDSITKVQRRTFLRVPAEQDIAISVSDQLRFVAVTEDIGGGGVSFVYDKQLPFEVKTTVKCWLLLSYRNGKVEHIPFKGEVIRVGKPDNGKSQAMVRFDEIADRDRQKVIRFCYERQLDLRKI